MNKGPTSLSKYHYRIHSMFSWVNQKKRNHQSVWSMIHEKLGGNKCSLQREEALSARAPLRFGGRRPWRSGSASAVWGGRIGGLRRARQRKSGAEATRSARAGPRERDFSRLAGAPPARFHDGENPTGSWHTHKRKLAPHQLGFESLRRRTSSTPPSLLLLPPQPPAPPPSSIPCCSSLLNPLLLRIL
jgi:hypothetical protein